jgi:NAD-dependent oxidoreductase involved in siderophore biosynthesis
VKLLKEMEEAESRLETLLQEAEDSGPATETTAQDWANIKKRLKGFAPASPDSMARVIKRVRLGLPEGSLSASHVYTLSSPDPSHRRSSRIDHATTRHLLAMYRRPLGDEKPRYQLQC